MARLRIHESNAARQRAYRVRHLNRNMGQLRHYWLTPPELYAALDAEFHFNFDPCPFPRPVGFDGLSCEWGACNYVNPPFKHIDGGGLTAWVNKAIAEQEKGKTSVVVLPCRALFIKLAQACGAEVRMLGNVKWLATEDGSAMRQGCSNPIAAWIIRGHGNSRKSPSKWLKRKGRTR